MLKNLIYLSPRDPDIIYKKVHGETMKNKNQFSSILIQETLIYGVSYILGRISELSAHFPPPFICIIYGLYGKDVLYVNSLICGCW